MDDREIEEFEEFIELEMMMLRKVDEIARDFVKKRREKVEFRSDNIRYGMPNMAPNVANHGVYITEDYRYSREESA